MTSRPLFIIVAESIVILRPIFHVGCLQRLLGTHLLELVAREATKRPARRGENQSTNLAPLHGRAGIDARRCARCRSGESQRLAARRLRHQLARHDEHFLVSDGDRLPGVDGSEHGFETRGTGRRANDDVGVGIGRNRHQAFCATGQRCRRIGATRCAQPVHGFRFRQCRDTRPIAPNLLGQQLGSCHPRPAQRQRAWSGAHRQPPAHSDQSSLSSRELPVVSRDVSNEQIKRRDREQKRVDPVEHAAVPRNE